MQKSSNIGKKKTGVFPQQTHLNTMENLHNTSGVMQVHHLLDLEIIADSGSWGQIHATPKGRGHKQIILGTMSSPVFYKDQGILC